MYSVSSSSGCSSGVKLNLLEWKQCDTLAKKIGFIAGATINCTAQNVASLSKQVNKVLHLDKAANYACKFFNAAIKKFIEGVNNVVSFADKHIKPIFINELTKKTFKCTYNNILTPLGRVIRSVAKFVFVTCIWNHGVIPFTKHVLKPIFTKCQSKCQSKAAIRKINTESSAKVQKQATCSFKYLNNVCDWTLVPLYNRVLVPVGTSLSECFHGLLSGCIRPKAPVRKEEKKEETNVAQETRIVKEKTL